MAGERRSDRRAGGLRDVGEGLQLHRVLDAAEERFILLLRAGARDRDRAFLRGSDEVLGRLPWAVVVHPEEEGIEGEVRDRREVGRFVRKLLRDDRGEEGVEGDEDVVHVTLVVVDVRECHRARGAFLVQWLHRLRRKLLGLDDPLPYARVDIRTAAGCGADHELDRMGRLHRGRRGPPASRAGARRRAGARGEGDERRR